MDKFITKGISALPQSSKQEFMNLFTALSKRSGSLASQDIISQAFGNQSGSGALFAQISTRLNSRLK